MGFTQYSTPIAPPDLYEPLPLDQILQGAKTVYERGEKNFEKVQGLINAAYSIPSLPGKDTEVKNRKMQEYMANIQELAKGNLADPRTANQIQGYISSIAQDPDMIGIAERATSYANMLKEKKEAEAKGNKYYNQGLFEANRYLQGNTYIRDQRFTNKGGIAPNEAEILEKVKKIANAEVTQRKANGVYTTVEQILEEEGQALYERIANSDPNYRQYYRVMWDEQNYGKSPEQIFSENIAPYYNTLVQRVNLLQQKIPLAKNDIEKAATMASLREAVNEISKLESLRDNPNTQEELKELAFNRQLKQSANAAIQAITGISKIDIKTDEYALDNHKTKNEILKTKQIEQFKLLLPGAQHYNLTNDELSSLIQKGSIVKNNQTITLDDVATATIEYKANEAYKKAEQQAIAKAKVKEEKLQKIGSYSLKPTDDVSIGGTVLQAQQWFKHIEGWANEEADADPSALAAIIKEYPEAFKLSETDVIGLEGSHISKPDSKGKIKIKKGFFEGSIDIGSIKDFQSAVNKAAIKAKLAKPNPIDLTTNSVNYNPKDSTTTFNFKKTDGAN